MRTLRRVWRTRTQRDKGLLRKGRMALPNVAGAKCRGAGKHWMASISVRASATGVTRATVSATWREKAR